MPRFGRFLPPAMSLVGIAGLTVAFAACGGSPVTTSASTAAPTPSLAPASAAPSADFTSGPSTVLEVQADEYTLTPTTLTAPAGSITFTVTNIGTENHEFEVLSGEQSLGKIDSFPRETIRELTVRLEPGEYTFACRLNGHHVLGMTGTLTVTGS